VFYLVSHYKHKKKKKYSKREVPPKRRYVSVNLHGVMSHNTVIYTFTASKTAYLAKQQTPRCTLVYTYSTNEILLILRRQNFIIYTHFIFHFSPIFYLPTERKNNKKHNVSIVSSIPKFCTGK